MNLTQSQERIEEGSKVKRAYVWEKRFDGIVINVDKSCYGTRDDLLTVRNAKGKERKGYRFEWELLPEWLCKRCGYSGNRGDMASRRGQLECPNCLRGGGYVGLLTQADEFIEE